jgi:hypothetical protein
VNTSRGPLRQFLVSLGGDSFECVQRCEALFRSDPYAVEDADIILRASLTNPPFYSLDEQVTSFSFTPLSLTHIHTHSHSHHSSLTSD